MHVDGAGAGINISLKNIHKAFLVAIVEQGADGTAHVVTPKQSTGNAGSATGTSEKGFTKPLRFWYNENCEINNILALAAAIADGVAQIYTMGIDQTRTKMVVVEIVPAESMDIANGFDCVTLDISDVGALNSVIMFALLDPVRFAPLPTVYAD
jgi:hypothetical protein